MKHWNFFPSLFLLLALFWAGFVELRLKQMEFEEFSPPTFNIKSDLTDPAKPLDFKGLDLPPMIIVPELLEPTFDPQGKNSAQNDKKDNQSPRIPKSS